MPGTRLTSGQVQRLCGVEETLCQLGLNELVETKFLFVSADGLYTGAPTEKYPVHVWREPSVSHLL